MSRFNVSEQFPLKMPAARLNPDAEHKLDCARPKLIHNNAIPSDVTRYYRNKTIELRLSSNVMRFAEVRH